MKKGFTLVELLAVIIILAIVLAIAIPNVLSAINDTKLKAYLTDENMMVKAAKNYIGVNDSYLPVNIGDTKEITLENLQNNNFIKTINNPKNKNDSCDGYVLITKTGNNTYAYTPKLNCESDMGSISEDKLVGYWNLGPIDEGTTNLFAGGLSKYNNLSVPSTIATTGEYYMGAPVCRLTMTPTTQAQVDSIRNNYWNQGVYGSGRTYLANTKYTTSIYWKAINKSDVSVNGTASNIGGWIASGNEMLGDGWTRCITKRDGSVTTDKTDTLFWSFRSPSFTLGETIIIDWAAPQIEQKDHQTRYVAGTRNDVAFDYSSNNNHGTIYGATLVADRFNKANSALKFDGVDDYIGLGTVNDSILTQGNEDKSWTLSVWLENIQPQDANYRIVLARTGWHNGIEMEPDMSVKFQIFTETDQPESITTQPFAQGSNHHVVATYTNRTMYLYVDGNLVGTNDYFLTNSAVKFKLNTSPFTIGAASGGGTHQFKGTVNDIRIYTRALSSQEIMDIYDIEKSFSR